MATQTQSNQAQENQKLPDLKIKKDLEAIEKAFATVKEHLTVSNIQSENFADKIGQAKTAAQNFSQSLNQVRDNFQSIGSDMGLSEKTLGKFVEKQKEAFENQSIESFTDSMREIQLLTGMTSDEMGKFVEQFGELGKKFKPLSGLGTCRSVP